MIDLAKHRRVVIRMEGHGVGRIWLDGREIHCRGIVFQAGHGQVNTLTLSGIQVQDVVIEAAEAAVHEDRAAPADSPTGLVRG